MKVKLGHQWAAMGCEGGGEEELGREVGGGTGEGGRCGVWGGDGDDGDGRGVMV